MGLPWMILPLVLRSIKLTTPEYIRECFRLPWRRGLVSCLVGFHQGLPPFAESTEIVVGSDLEKGYELNMSQHGR